MSKPTETIKSYGEAAVIEGRKVADTLVETGKTGVLAAIGATDVVVDHARSVVGSLRSKAEALPGEAQVQADLAAKEVRTRAEAARSKAGNAGGLVGTVREQAASTLSGLAARGEEVVEDLRRQPGFRSVVGRAERAVDTVEDALEDVLDTTDEVVAKASDEVTSVAQKSASKASKAANEVTSAAQKTKARTSKAVDEAKETPTKKAPAKRAAAKRTPAKATTKAPLPRATAVPAKSTAPSASSNAPSASSQAPSSSSSAPSSQS